ncbi:MAG: phosphoribosylglycinamide formyltransferase [Solirubrobacterales bacterium]
MSAFRVAVLASGAGTNLQAILDKVHGRDGIEVVAVASDKPGAEALARAEQAGIDSEVFARNSHRNREARDAVMADWLEQRSPDLIVLAGYMLLLSPPFVERFRGRMINVHPALLPAFPGLDAVGQALAHGVTVTGITVHFVDEGVDSGPILLQRAVEVPYTRDRDELESEMHRIEHELLPEAIRMIASGQVTVDPDNSRVIQVER